MRIGFIGTGVISEAMIRGLCDVANYKDPIIVSQRSVERSEALANQYTNVEVSTHNQNVVDQSDWVFVGVLPEQVPMVLDALNFRADQRIVSLAAGVSLEVMRPLIAPCAELYRAIPMPPIEFAMGPIAVCPKNEALEAFCNQVGVAVSVDDEAQFNLFGAVSALMSDFFEHVAGTSQWMTDHGLDRTTAVRYSTALYVALADLTMREHPERLHAMSESCETPGGLNEQFRKLRHDRGTPRSLIEGLDQILQRLEVGNPQDGSER